MVNGTRTVSSIYLSRKYVKQQAKLIGPQPITPKVPDKGDLVHLQRKAELRHALVLLRNKSLRNMAQLYIHHLFLVNL